jgi:hypothetical protein
MASRLARPDDPQRGQEGAFAEQARPRRADPPGQELPSAGIGELSQTAAGDASPSSPPATTAGAGSRQASSHASPDSTPTPAWSTLACDTSPAKRATSRPPPPCALSRHPQAGHGEPRNPGHRTGHGPQHEQVTGRPAASRGRAKSRPAGGISRHRIANWLQPATVTFHNGLGAGGPGGLAAPGEATARDGTGPRL